MHWPSFGRADANQSIRADLQRAILHAADARQRGLDSRRASNACARGFSASANPARECFASAGFAR